MLFKVFLQPFFIRGQGKQIMGMLYYGTEAPKISFYQSPQGSLSFNFENGKIAEFEDSGEITWLHLHPNPSDIMLFHTKDFDLPPIDEELLPDPLAKSEAAFHKLIDNLGKLIQTPEEKKFFLNYVSLCLSRNKIRWLEPALIPQVWVNWIHYDSKDSNRAERVQREPFRVDFVLKDHEISQKLTVVEIDGSSHFSSMDAYTQHIRKDRWLRKEGFEVFRLTNQEIDECEDFWRFFNGIFINTRFKKKAKLIDGKIYY